MRLQRALARAGFSSRRGAEELIRAGQVLVNGRVAGIGQSVDPSQDVILVGGRRVRPARTVWIALHKPLGVVVTRRDARKRQTVFDLLPHVPGLTYVGRLDAMTTGLLLLTTDGTGAHHLTHPRFEVERAYRVLVHGRPESEVRKALSRRIEIEGRAVNIVKWRTRPAARGATDLLLVLAEGRHRIVRRTCEKLGLKVEALTRLSYGPIQLGRLAPGEWRYLSRGEIDSLAQPGRAMTSEDDRGR